MKNKVIIITLFVTGVLLNGPVNAQENLLPDQNPRYKESQAKYLAMADTITVLQGTAVQKTYKAFDWYQDKLDRRQQRREWRHQEIMSGAYYSPSWSLYSGYGYGYPYSNFGYGGYGWGGGRWGRSGFWGPRASVGIGFGW